MYLVKSFFVVIVLLGFLWYSLILLREFIYAYQQASPYLSKGIKCGIIAIITMCAFLCGRNYMWPFDRNVKMETVVTVTDAEEYDRFSGMWFGVYEGSISFHKNYIDEWIDLDLANYSYIVSFGRPVESLTYNVWEKMQGPYQSNIYSGHAELGDATQPMIIYIYRIPRIRIDNDAL